MNVERPTARPRSRVLVEPNKAPLELLEVSSLAQGLPSLLSAPGLSITSAKSRACAGFGRGDAIGSSRCVSASDFPAEARRAAFELAISNVNRGQGCDGLTAWF